MTVFQRVFRDESGQATVEYILLVAIAVGLAVIVLREFVRPAMAKLTKNLSAKIENAFFGNMHHFPVRR